MNVEKSGGNRLVAESVTIERGPRAHRRTILDGISVSFDPGMVVGLIGPNGAGKSTLLAALSGDLTPTTGQVLVGGKSYRELGARRAAQLRAVMLQDTHYRFNYTVRDIVAMGRTAWPHNPLEDAQRVQRAIATVGIEHLADRVATTLSGGERARTALARVICQDAAITMLDEPTAAMDIGHSEHTFGLVRELADAGRTVITVIHDLSIAARHCDRLLLLANSRIEADGSPKEVLTAERLSTVYQTPIAVTHCDQGVWIRPR